METWITIIGLIISVLTSIVAVLKAQNAKEEVRALKMNMRLGLRPQGERQVRRTGPPVPGESFSPIPNDPEGDL